MQKLIRNPRAGFDQYQIEVHPWFNVSLRQREFLSHFYGPGTPADAFDVHRPDFRTFISNLMIECVSRYPVHGINLDYIRSVSICQSPECARQYHQHTNRNLMLDRLSYGASADAREAIADWNEQAVGDIVRRVSGHVRKHHPNIVMSLCGHPGHPNLYIQGQKSIKWADEGLIDVVYDMREKKQPDNPATFNLRARTLLAKKDTPGARAAFDKALSLNPTFFPPAASLAALDLAEKKPDDARKRFESVLTKDPKNIQAMLALAELRANNGGSVDEVSGLMAKAVTAKPTEMAPRLALIQYWLQQKDNKKALTAANDAVAAFPEKPEVLDALGRVQQITGDLNQALSTYGKLAGLQPTTILIFT